MAGTVIAGALVTGIKSDLPGDVIATVKEPVYDTATGRFLLIPQGSRIMGRYNSQVSYGQSRVQVVWNRIILPDTSSLTLDNPDGTDPAGYAGLEDGVDWHWDRIFAGAVLTTLLGIGAEIAAPENRQDGNRVIIAGRGRISRFSSTEGEADEQGKPSPEPRADPQARCGQAHDHAVDGTEGAARCLCGSACASASGFGRCRLTDPPYADSFHETRPRLQEGSSISSCEVLNCMKPQ